MADPDLNQDFVDLLAALLKNKRAAGRDKDLLDVKLLERRGK